MSSARRVQELRRSNAAQPIPSGKTYRRKAKHRKAQGEADGYRGRNDEAPRLQGDRGA